MRELPDRKSEGVVISWTGTQSRVYGDSKRVGVDPLTPSILKWFDGSLDVEATCNRKSAVHLPPVLPDRVCGRRSIQDYYLAPLVVFLLERL